MSDTIFSAGTDSQVEGLVVSRCHHHQFDDLADSHDHSEGIEYFTSNIGVI
jgi:hypothetical protein